MSIEQLNMASIGDVVSFGNQDWIFAFKTHKRALLISAKKVATEQFGATKSWEDSSLRKWLNSSFFDTTFSSEEKNQILSSEIANETICSKYLDDLAGVYDFYRDEGHEKKYVSSPCNVTVDRVFVLSYSEYEFYKKMSSSFMPENDAELQTISEWTRSSFKDGSVITFRSNEMSFDDPSGQLAVRPCIWVDLSGEVSSEKWISAKIVDGAIEFSYVDDISTVQENDRVMFASYPEHTTWKITSSGKYPLFKSPIVWEIKKIKNGKLLLVSKILVANKQFDDNLEKKSLSWNSSSLRKWLNEDFYKVAFSNEEKKRISEEEIKFEKRGSIKSLRNTKDKVFILSEKEAQTYFGKHNWGDVVLPDYVCLNSNRYFAHCKDYWSRTCIPQNCSFQTAGLISKDYYSDWRANEEGAGVRPAIWVNLNEISISSIEEDTTLIDSVISRTDRKVMFGNSNGVPIEWEIIAAENNKVLIVSKNSIANMQFHNKDEREVFWKDCSLRNWLNEDFYNKSFSEEEKKYIVEKETVTCYNGFHSHSDWHKWCKDGGPNSLDRVFVLSEAELELFVGTFMGEEECWARTPEYIGFAITGNPNNRRYHDSTYKIAGVRPAMWVDISLFDN